MKYLPKHCTARRYINVLQIFVPVVLLVIYELQISSVMRHKALVSSSAVSSSAPNIVSGQSNKFNEHENDTRKPALVLMVVIGIPDGYPTYASIAQASHRAYASRYSYRLLIQRKYLGKLKSSNIQDSRAVMMQKLLAYSLAREGERYVLVIDYDTVIAPWTPPIHERLKDLNGRIGLVEANVQNEGIAANGILNGGALVFEPQMHENWMRPFYDVHIYNPASTFQEDQRILRADLIGKKLVLALNVAWGRNGSSGMTTNELGTLFKKIYFMNFFGDKDSLIKLNRWTKEKNISFEFNYPVQYNVSP